MSTDTAENRLVLQQAIDSYTESIVNAADATLPEERVVKLRNARMGKAQFSTFLGVTLETGSPAAIDNWVRYQMGRRDNSRTWADGLGVDVLRKLKEMEGWAKDVAKQAYQQSGQREEMQVHTKLIRLYAGYLMRWYVARGGDS